MKRFLLASVAAIAVVAPAAAADLGAAPDYYSAPPAAEAATWAAYFDIHGGYGFGEGTGSADKIGFYDYDEDWDETIVGGALRGAYFISPAFSVQGDVWANRYDGDGDGTGGLVEDAPYDFDFESTYVGAGGHLTYNAAPGSLAGVLASYGWTLGDDDSEYVNVGLEAAHEFGAFRLYGQGGYTLAVSGDAEAFDTDAWYGAGVLSYYFNDNWVLSGNLGYSQTSSDAFDEDVLAWGATIEAMPWQLPVSLYASYEGYHWDGENFAFDYDGTEHTFFVGARFLAGASSVRERDQTVGLKDMNPLFGDFP